MLMQLIENNPSNLIEWIRLAEISQTPLLPKKYKFAQSPFCSSCYLFF